MKDEKYFKTKIQNTIENLEQTQENLETDMFAIDGIDIAIEMLKEIIKEQTNE